MSKPRNRPIYSSAHNSDDAQPGGLGKRSNTHLASILAAAASSVTDQPHPMSQLLTGSDLLDSFKKEPQKEPQPFDTLVPVAVLRQVSFPYTFSTPNAPLPPASLPVEAQVSSEKNSPAPQAPLSQANIESSTKAGVSRQLKAKIASLKAASRSSSVQPSVRPSVRPSAQSSVQVSQTGPAPSQTGPATDSCASAR